MVSKSIAMTESTHCNTQVSGTPFALNLAEKLVDLRVLPQETLPRKQDPPPFLHVGLKAEEKGPGC